jgi:5-methylcytosine-specific restriction protein A
VPLLKRACRGFRCPATVDSRDGFCDACRLKLQRAIDRNRGSSRDRGYDRVWEKLRDLVRAEEPICRMCLAEGNAELTEEIDHIIPISGPDDPLRLERSNLQGLCGRHHRVKTRQENPR